MGVDYKMVVEDVEWNRYAERMPADKLLRLPFSDLGQGSIPARNWIWEHAIESGASSHWVLDDNIEGFNRLNRNTKYVVHSGAMFKAAEDFVARYENVALEAVSIDELMKGA